MSGIIKKLEEQIEARVKQQVGVLEPKLDRMVAALERIEKLLQKIEKNTSK